MGLREGTKLGPYEITGALGAGGMGEVYRARDTKLSRDVALKVLPEAFVADPQRMARFEREAQVLASLNHPNIAMIHGLEESGSTRALVMELVEGETLAERLRRGPLPRDDALPIANQIAEGLEYAHNKGVIHRDLKPANVKTTPEGTVKILDFGLAKALEVDASILPSNASNSPTLSVAATQAGMILGTAAYMAPEQAKAKPVDRRADIWAFGCVLYEMLSGRKAFEGETISDVLAAVIMKDPDWTALPETTPASIQKLIRRCLNKDSKQRLRDIGEARITIEETLSGEPDAGAIHELPPPEASFRRQRVLPWIITSVAVAALVVAVYLGRFTASVPQASPVLAYVPPPPNLTIGQSLFLGPPSVVISPGGKQLAFPATDENGVTKLYVRALDSNEAKAIAGTEDAAFPFWSPDGGSLGFFANQKLKTVNLANGNVQTLADASCGGTGGAWGPSGMILFTPCGGPLSEIPSSGGKPTAAAKLQNSKGGAGQPAFLPDGRHFLYESNPSNINPSSIWMGSLGSSGQKLVLKGARSPEFASGHLLFVRDNRVFAQPFDPASGKLSGEAAALVAAQSYSVTSGGALAYQGGSRESRLGWYDRSGNPLGSIGPTAIYAAARISPDGSHILVDLWNPQSETADLWSYPATGGPGTRLTFGPGMKLFSVWSPSGKYIAYQCPSKDKPLGGGICRKAADGSGAAQSLFTFGPGVAYGRALDWSPDGRHLTFDEMPAKTGHYEVWALSLLGDRKPFRPAAVNAGQGGGNFSPDGRWLAYYSTETGRPEVFVVPFPGPGGKFQISQNGGWSSRWDKKGRLYFLNMGNRLMEADLETNAASLRVKAIYPLFPLNPPNLALGPVFDVSADGSRFLVITSTDPNASRSIGLLLNWQAKLRGKQ